MWSTYINIHYISSPANMILTPSSTTDHIRARARQGFLQNVIHIIAFEILFSRRADRQCSTHMFISNDAPGGSCAFFRYFRNTEYSDRVRELIISYQLILRSISQIIGLGELISGFDRTIYPYPVIESLIYLYFLFKQSQYAVRFFCSTSN